MYLFFRNGWKQTGLAPRVFLHYASFHFHVSIWCSNGAHGEAVPAEETPVEDLPANPSALIPLQVRADLRGGHSSTSQVSRLRAPDYSRQRTLRE